MCPKAILSPWTHIWKHYGTTIVVVILFSLYPQTSFILAFWKVFPPCDEHSLASLLLIFPFNSATRYAEMFTALSLTFPSTDWPLLSCSWFLIHFDLLISKKQYSHFKALVYSNISLFISFTVVTKSSFLCMGGRGG